jgi:hypothetical protein
MNSSRTDPVHNSPHESHKSERELTVTKVAASALAAISAAIAASFFGAAGTVIGAGLGSVIATVSTALYQQSLKRTGEKLKQVVPRSAVIVRQRGPAHEPPDDAADVPELGVHGAPAPDHHDPRQSPGDPSAPAAANERGTWSSRLVDAARSVRWSHVAMASAAVFVIAFGAVLAVETLGGKSVSSFVRNEKTGGNTWDRLVNQSGSRDAPEDVPSQTPTSAPPSDEPTSPPSEAPSETPTESPSPPETAPSSEAPDVAPSEPAPAQTPAQTPR